MKNTFIRLTIGAMMLFLTTVNAFTEDTPKSVIRYDRDSKYYRIIVADYPNLDRRVLYFSKTRGAQSSMILSKPRSLGLSYLRTMMASFALAENPRNVLLVGLGGAAIPKFIADNYPDIKLDIVEIDPDVVKVARDYFYFKPTENMRLFAMDGRIFMKQSDMKYDLIILDAYASDSLPFHLTTVEFFELVRERLSPGGVIAANLWEYFVNKFFMSELKTVQSVFRHTYLFSTPDPASKVLFAGTGDEAVTSRTWIERAVRFVGNRDFGYSLPDLIRREYSNITDMNISENILTDDMAPVDLLRTKRAQ